MAVDESRASVSLHGVAPAAIVTEVLGLSPSSSHNMGERQNAQTERVWKTSHWKRTSGLPSGGDDLEAHLRTLVDLLAPKQSEIERLVADGWRLTWACFISEDNGQGGITLSPQILRDLGALPGDLWLDIYAGTNDNEG